MSTPVKVPPNTVIILGSKPYKLTWDKAAMFRADEIGVYEKRKPGIGLALTAKYVWAMLPDEGRDQFATPQAVAVAMPPLREVNAIASNAIEAGKEATDPKNVFGSTNGRKPSSS